MFIMAIYQKWLYALRLLLKLQERNKKACRNFAAGLT
jgi:hypothetical protein